MAKKKSSLQAQAPLILRAHRLMEAFAKSDDEREFYLDTVEGFIVYVDLDKAGEELDKLMKELEENESRYILIPKLTFYAAKKIMEGFVHEKVYDIDIKEKLLDIISSKNARENFLEFIYDHLIELEKWQQYYQERSRIRIIEWLRQANLHFVFEEDLDFPSTTLEKVKSTLFEEKIPTEIASARKFLESKAKTYYSNEALNPRPKRGRPPKQQVKQESEPQVTVDLYTQVPSCVRPFLFTPEIGSAADVTFAASFEGNGDGRGLKGGANADATLHNLQKRLDSLKKLSSGWLDDDDKTETVAKPAPAPKKAAPAKPKAAPAPKVAKATPVKKAPAKKPAAKKATTTKKVAEKKEPKAPKKRKLTRTKPKKPATK